MRFSFVGLGQLIIFCDFDSCCAKSFTITHNELVVDNDWLTLQLYWMTCMNCYWSNDTTVPVYSVQHAVVQYSFVLLISLVISQLVTGCVLDCICWTESWWSLLGSEYLLKLVQVGRRTGAICVSVWVSKIIKLVQVGRHTGAICVSEWVSKIIKLVQVGRRTGAICVSVWVSKIIKLVQVGHRTGAICVSVWVSKIIKLVQVGRRTGAICVSVWVSKIIKLVQVGCRTGAICVSVWVIGAWKQWVTKHCRQANVLLVVLWTITSHLWNILLSTIRPATLINRETCTRWCCHCKSKCSELFIN